MQNFFRPIFILAGCFALAACWPEDDTTGDAENKAPRAVKTIVAEERPAIQLRRFPSVLEPPQLVPLSFEVGGRVSEVDLRVGQQVAAGELLATIGIFNSVKPKPFCKKPKLARTTREAKQRASRSFSNAA